MPTLADFRIRKTGDQFMVRQHEAGRWVPVGDPHLTRAAAAAWIAQTCGA